MAFCLVVLPLMALLFPVERWFHYFSWYVILAGCWLYGVYFLNRLVTVPALFKRGAWRLIGIVLIVVSLAVTYCISDVKLYVFKPSHLDNGIVRIFPNVTHHQEAVWALFGLVETFSFAVALLVRSNEQSARRRQVEAERDRAEINLFKAQIKPHFMFNTLNSLYGLFLTGSDQALASLEKFISMIRYVHTSSSRNMVQLQEETDYVSMYVDLQCLRLNEQTEVELDIDIADPTMLVPPMLLVTFVENCFKHGISPVEYSKIRISLSEKEGILHFSTINRIFATGRPGERMGIENCRKRLALTFPDHHHLVINDDGVNFKVELQIELQHTEDYEMYSHR
jgi:LytS/YehU family sensor histidine kinase